MEGLLLLEWEGLLKRLAKFGWQSDTAQNAGFPGIWTGLLYLANGGFKALEEEKHLLQ